MEPIKVGYMRGNRSLNSMIIIQIKINRSWRNNLKKDWKPWQLVQYGDQGLEDVKDNFQLAIE